MKFELNRPETLEHYRCFTTLPKSLAKDVSLKYLIVLIVLSFSIIGAASESTLTDPSINVRYCSLNWSHLFRQFQDDKWVVGRVLNKKKCSGSESKIQLETLYTEFENSEKKGTCLYESISSIKTLVESEEFKKSIAKLQQFVFDKKVTLDLFLVKHCYERYDETVKKIPSKIKGALKLKYKVKVGDSIMEREVDLFSVVRKTKSCIDFSKESTILDILDKEIKNYDENHHVLDIIKLISD